MTKICFCIVIMTFLNAKIVCARNCVFYSESEPLVQKMTAWGLEWTSDRVLADFNVTIEDLQDPVTNLFDLAYAVTRVKVSNFHDGSVKRFRGSALQHIYLQKKGACYGMGWGRQTKSLATERAIHKFRNFFQNFTCETLEKN